MTAFKRFGAAAIAMVAIGALGLPSSALAGKSHHLKLYKVEQHIDIEGDLDYTISCKPGDIATDGMWRIDDVSQDNEFDILEQWTETVAIKATTVPGTTEDYVFQFLPIAGGDVQGKLWVTCLENPTDGNGHSHSWNVVDVRGTTTPVTAPTPGPVTGQNYTMVSGAGGSITGTPTPANTCPSGSYIPIAPGFDMTANGGEGYGYLQKNWHFSSGGKEGWEWEFNVKSAGPGVGEQFQPDLTFRCLEKRSNLGGSGAGHRHRIVQQYKSKSNINHPARTFQTHQLSCGEHYKGMVGMWWSHHFDLYYLGMDPRIKARAFKFVNIGPADHVLDLKLSCFKDRTT
jgi:hypothetical protein